MFEAIAAATTRRPWLVIGAWVVVAVALCGSRPEEALRGHDDGDVELPPDLL